MKSIRIKQPSQAKRPTSRYCNVHPSTPSSRCFPAKQMSERLAFLAVSELPVLLRRFVCTSGQNLRSTSANLLNNIT